MKMALQTADAVPVRYGPTERWQRVTFDEEEDDLPKGRHFFSQFFVFVFKSKFSI